MRRGIRGAHAAGQAATLSSGTRSDGTTVRRGIWYRAASDASCVGRSHAPRRGADSIIGRGRRRRGPCDVDGGVRPSRLRRLSQAYVLAHAHARTRTRMRVHAHTNTPVHTHKHTDADTPADTTTRARTPPHTHARIRPRRHTHRHTRRQTRASARPRASHRRHCCCEALRMRARRRPRALPPQLCGRPSSDAPLAAACCTGSAACRARGKRVQRRVPIAS
jgi:hypothetical protein